MSTEQQFFKVQWDQLRQYIPSGCPEAFEPEAGLPGGKSMLLRAQGGSKDAADVRRWCVGHLYGAFRRIEELEAQAWASTEGAALMAVLPDHIRQLPLEDRIKCVENVFSSKTVASVADEAVKSHIYEALPKAIRELSAPEQVNQIQRFFSGEAVQQDLETLNHAAAFRDLRANLLKTGRFTQSELDEEPLDVLIRRDMAAKDGHDDDVRALKDQLQSTQKLSESRLILYTEAMKVISDATALLKGYAGTLRDRVSAVLRDAAKSSKTVGTPDEEISRLQGELSSANEEISRLTGDLGATKADLDRAKSTSKIYYGGWKRSEKVTEHITTDGLARVARMLATAKDRGMEVPLAVGEGGMASEGELLSAVEHMLLALPEPSVCTEPTVTEAAPEVTPVEEDNAQVEELPQKFAAPSTGHILTEALALLREQMMQREAGDDEPRPGIMVSLRGEGECASTNFFDDVRVVKVVQARGGITFRSGEGALALALPVVPMNSLVLLAAWNGEVPVDWVSGQPAHMSTVKLR